jgi:hypothetical protein
MPHLRRLSGSLSSSCLRYRMLCLQRLASSSLLDRDWAGPSPFPIIYFASGGLEGRNANSCRQ